MDNTLLIHAIIRLVESRVKEHIDYREIEKAVGLSYRHFREEFRRYTKMSLKQYINSRKIANIIFEMETSDKSLLTLAYDYGFHSYDTFTRCFAREMSITPSRYRRENRNSVKRGLIGMGTYAPVVADSNKLNTQTAEFQDDSYVLYGVPKVEFANGKCTPFPACMESVFTYIGQREHCSYTWLTAASGIAFRFCWNAGKWDMSNSNIMNLTPQNPWELYERVCGIAGWKCSIIEIGSDITKDFLTGCVVDHIEKGRPLIALGVVGPPEACVITGCRSKGEEIYGWSYFQDNPEFSADIEIDKSGYFLCSEWWKLPKTTALITLDQPAKAPSLKEILQHIYAVLTMQSAGMYQAGQNAYQSWMEDLSDDTAFQENNITPVLLSRFFCQADAETMVGEGRYWGAQFFKKLGAEQTHISELCFQAAELLTGITECVREMTAVRQGDNETEEAIRILCKPNTRKEITTLIKKAQMLERRVIDVVDTIVQSLSKTSRDQS